MISKRTEKCIGVIFFVIGIFVVIDVGYLTHELNRQQVHIHDRIDCNSKLLNILRSRSDARILVDETTANAQQSLAALLEDMEEQGSLPANDPHVIEAKKEFQKAAEVRGNPDLWIPYPDC